MTLLLLLLAPVSAKCRMPQPIVSSDGEVVPADPVVWVFVPRREVGDFVLQAQDAQGRAVPSRVERVPGGRDLQVWKVALDTSGDGRVSLKASWTHYGSETLEASVTVRESWSAPALSAPSVQDAGVTRLSWTCSHQETRDLAVVAPAAVAYELVWAGSEADWARGEVQTATLPSHWSQVFGERRSPELALGHLNCTGEWFEWRLPRVWVGLRALYADGSRSPLSAPLAVAAP
jgi:hypothetical protein